MLADTKIGVPKHLLTDIGEVQSRYGILLRRVGAKIPAKMAEDIIDCETNQGRCVLLHAVERQKIYSDFQSVAADCQRLQPQMNVVNVLVTQGVIAQVKAQLENAESQTKTAEGTDTEALGLFRSIITWAVMRDASDVHMEIYPTHCKVRVRVNGFLMEYPIKNVEKEQLESAIRGAYNVMADAGSRSAPGDLPDNSVASASIDIDLMIDGARKDYKLRMESSPDFGGRTAVFRLNDMGKYRSLAMKRGDMAELHRTLLRYGYADDQSRCIIEAVRGKRGMFVVGGPVGSGKTTLLYTILVFTSEDGIISRAIEDPIEAELPGVRQVAASVGVNMDSLSQVERDQQYAKFLRSALRMDVDQLLVGEIRSREMAQVALDLYQSGHAGFCTMHFGQVFNVVDRLTSDTMGLDRDVVAQEGFFRLVMVQELLPVLCDCKLTAAEAHLDGGYVAMMEKVIGLHDAGISVDNVRFKNQVGCPKCKERTPGIRGREAVAEVMEDSSAMMAALRHRRYPQAHRLFSLDRHPLDDPRCMGRTIFENALHKILIGRVDPRDVEAVLQPFAKAIRDKEQEAVIRNGDIKHG